MPARLQILLIRIDRGLPIYIICVFRSGRFMNNRSVWDSPSIYTITKADMDATRSQLRNNATERMFSNHLVDLMT